MMGASMPKVRTSLPALLVVALGCGAPASPSRAPAPLAAKGRPAPTEHDREARSLGLSVGTVATYLFSANLEDRGQDGTRRERWTCSFSDHVLRARDVDALGDRRTIIELRRTIDLDACDAPQEDWQLTPRPGRIFYILGGAEMTHEIPDYAKTRPGLGVYRQDNSLDLGSLDDAELEYVLPLRAGVLWHSDAEARRDARTGEKVVTLSRRTEGVKASVETPAGAFQGCAVIITWA